MSEDEADAEDTIEPAAGRVPRDDHSRSAEHDPWLRAAALGGIVTLPLALVGTTLADLVGPDNLGPGSPEDELLAMLVDSHGKQIAAATMFTVTSAATLCFLGPLWARVRTGSEWLAVVAVAGYRHHVFGPRFNAVGAGFTVLLVIGLFPGGPAGLMGILATAWVFVASLVLAFGTAPGPRDVHGH